MREKNASLKKKFIAKDAAANGKENTMLKVLYEDKYKRKIARVYYKNKEINLEMLRSGNVWFYEYHAKKEKEYRRAYEEARKEKKGIWKDINPENPRDFRLRNKRR